MSVTIIKDLEAAVLGAQRAVTIDELADGPGLVYRHPDSVQISYPKVVTPAIGTLPTSTTLNIGIVGAGPGGVAALYELRRLANATPNTLLNVTVFESDPANFLFTPGKHASNKKAITPRRAGRVSSYSVPNTIYEIGAMRFPSIAGLTWHYARAVFGGSTVVNPFPNPGTVPTEFTFGSQYDQYVGPDWLDMNSPTKLVRDLVIGGLVGTGQGTALFQIGGRDPYTIIGLLTNPATTPSELEQIGNDWIAFIQQYDAITLEGAVRRILTTRSASLPAVPGMTGQELINWCVELFGRFGFGTGGFKPLFSVSIVEIMRLILWDYSNEYTFPPDQAPGNVDFIAKLYSAATAAPPPNFRVTVQQGRVCDVFHYVNPRKAVVGYYLSGATQPTLQALDFVALAVPHEAAARMVSRLGNSSNPLPSGTLIGDIGATVPVTQTVLPALLLSTTGGQDAKNARPVAAISTLHMVSSSKVFATITVANAEGPEVPRFPASTGRPISAVISDCGLAATYMVPSPTNAQTKSFLVSYTWDDDSTRLQSSLSSWPEDAPPSGPSPMFNAMLNRTYRQDPRVGMESKWWLSTLLTNVVGTDRVSYDWTTTLATAGGFKLDMTGDYYQSNFTFRFHTHAAKPSVVDNRFFLASDSFTHLGGWLEGAFMSAINAVAGIVVGANNGVVASLNPEAQKLFTTLTPVT